MASSSSSWANANRGYDPKKLGVFLASTKKYSAIELGVVGSPAKHEDEEEEEAGDAEGTTNTVHQGGFQPKFKKRKDQMYIPKTPLGMVDIHPDKMVLRVEVFEKIRAVFKRHGALELETPVCELKETLTGKYGEDSKLIYDLKDQGGEILALRYDLTVPFARYVAEHGVERMRRFHIARVYRRDTAQVSQGRFREFYQCDFDAAGVYEDMVPDSECVKIVSEVLEQLEFRKFGVEYEVKVNHRALLDGVFALCGVPETHFRQICSAVDKLDKKPWGEVREEMIDKGLDEAKADLLGKFVSDPVSKRELDTLEALMETFPEENAGKNMCRTGFAALRKLIHFCQLMGVRMDNVKFDMSMARGLDYYTGVIYEVVLLREGKLYEVGSVAGGGRYDNLVGMFLKKKNKTVPCVGVSLGIERLITVLDALRANAGALPPPNIDVFVGAIDAGGFESLGHRMRICSQMWDAGLRAEFWHKKKVAKPNDQFEHCDKERIPVMLYFGGSEWKAGKVKVRRIFHTLPKGADGFNLKHEEECAVDEAIAVAQRLLAMTGPQE